MSEAKKILSITIPTYNRAMYLKRLLDSIVSQAIKYCAEVEVIIINNASTDNTEDVVYDFLSKVPAAKYIRNESNLGMDGNFKKCFDSASAKYFWMIGDDDFLSENAIQNVLILLNGCVNYDLIYVSSTITNNNSDAALDYDAVTTNDDFIRRVGIMFTFISGMICNKETYLSLPFDSKPAMKEGTFLMHMYWQLPLLKNGDEFVIINNNLIYATPDNSGGYRLFHVFSKNLSQLLDSFYNRKDYISTKIRGAAALFLMNFLNNAHKTRGYENENYITDCDYAFNDLKAYRYFLRFFYLFPVFLKFSDRVKPLIKKIMRK